MGKLLLDTKANGSCMGELWKYAIVVAFVGIYLEGLFGDADRRIWRATFTSWLFRINKAFEVSGFSLVGKRWAHLHSLNG